MPRPRIGFVLASNRQRPLPSTRISVLNMFPYLESAGYEPLVLFEPQTSDSTPDLKGLFSAVTQTRPGIVYFQKVHGPHVAEVARALGRQGVKTVYGVCDFVDPEMVASTDATVAVTEYLKRLYPASLHERIHVVHDGIEHPEVHKRAWRGDPGSKSSPLRLVLVTSQRLDEIPMLGRLPRFAEVVVVGNYQPAVNSVQAARNMLGELRAIKGILARAAYIASRIDRRVARVVWNPERALWEMLAADIGIIPVDMTPDPIPGKEVSWWQVRSENRLTMKMAIGLPVIAAPVPSYFDVIAHGVNGFVATRPDEWSRCLEQLRDPVLRREIGERARAAVIDRFSKDEQAKRLLAVFRGLP